MFLREAQETLLKRMAHVDGILRPIERKTIEAILKELGGDIPLQSEQTSRKILSSQLIGAIAELARRPMRERERIVQLLWVVAMCDGELHPREEKMVLRVADALGVPRSTVARQQPNF